MGKARELAAVVAKARRDILNRDTVRQCRLIYAAVIEQAERGASIGAYEIKGRVDLDLRENYDIRTIITQIRLKLELEGFEAVLVVSPDLEDGDLSIVFSFVIPEEQVLVPQETHLEVWDD